MPGDTRWVEAGLQAPGLPCRASQGAFDIAVDGKELRLSERKNGAPALLIQHDDGFDLVADSRDEQHLAVADTHGTLRIWPLVTARLLAMACARLPRAFADQARQGRVAALCAPGSAGR